jgi:hypothetical protein
MLKENMKKVLSFILMAVILLMSLSLVTSCQFNKSTSKTSFSSDLKSNDISITEQVAHSDSDHASSHCQNHCEKCNSNILFYDKSFARASTFSLVILSVFYFDHRFIYKSPFINFNYKPPISA